MVKENICPDQAILVVDNASIRQKYLAYLASIGIEIKNASKAKPKPIARDQYPDLSKNEIRTEDFDSFVAFDFETTGFSAKTDAIIEIGALKVVDGKIAEQAEFIFQELVKPLDKKINAEAEKLTGISFDDVKDAREIWKVFADFMDFVGDMPLVGYNCIKFDNKFMERAGRYAHIIVTNPIFDVMRYAEKFADELGIAKNSLSLANIAAALDISNERAHRALADAVTTAKVYLQLKNMEQAEKDSALDDILGDLDNW